MKWIPLKERLPEANTVVLVCYDNGEVDIMLQWWAGGQDPVYVNWLSKDDQCNDLTVLAWMPLPAPYVEVGVTTD